MIEDQILAEVLQYGRAKGSKNTIVTWKDRLQSTIDPAFKTRDQWIKSPQSKT